VYRVLFHLRPLFLLVAIFFAVTNSGCAPEKKPHNENTESLLSEVLPTTDPLLLRAQTEAARIAANLDIKRLSAQLIICGIDGKGRLNREMRTLLEECPAGGVMLFRYNLDTSTEEIQKFTVEISACISARSARDLVPDKDSTKNEESPEADDDFFCGIPPFVAVDQEGGQVSRFKKGVAVLPPAASYGELANNSEQDDAIALIETDSFRAGTEMFSLGINMNFAPVAESLNDDNREFLDTRSYGADPAFVSEAAAAFIRGMERAGVLCVVKHFPGSAGKDPHRFASIINDSIDELNVIISPFSKLIGTGQARALMAAHTLIPARDPARVASLSPVVMQNWLRDELGFSGIIICDDFSMTAAWQRSAGSSVPADHVAAAVKSLAAGADMVMAWPPDIRRTHRAIQNALADGSLSEERLREAAARIICEKIRMGLINVD